MPREGEGKARKAAARAAAETSAEAQAEVRTNGAHGTSGQLMIDLDFLRGLIEAVDASGIDSVEIVRAGTRVRISKSPPLAPVALPAPQAAPVVAPPAPAAHAPPPAGGVAAAPPTAPAAPAAPATRLVDVKSPMVGTFYRAPAPEAPAYVEPGSHVSKGQTLCILEAMKLMNELECEIDGIVREVLVDNGEPVEFGQVLFRVEPSGS